jgi:hypothetical protein
MDLTIGALHHLTYWNTSTLAQCGYAACRMSNDLFAFGGYHNMGYGNYPRLCAGKVNPDLSIASYAGSYAANKGECVSVCALSATKIVHLYTGEPESQQVQLYVRVGTWNGSSLSVGSEIAMNLYPGHINPAHGGAAIVALDGSTVAVVGKSPSTGYLRVVIGAVSGSSISFGSPVDVCTSPELLYCGGTAIARLTDTKYAITYVSFPEYALKLVVGTRSGTVATIVADSGITLTSNSKNKNASLVAVSGSMVAVSYYDTTLRRAARCATVSGVMVTLRGVTAIDSTETVYQEAAAIAAMPPVMDSLFPRRIVVGYRKNAGVDYYARIGNVSAAGTPTFTDAPTYCFGSASTYNNLFVIGLTDWKVVLLEDYYYTNHSGWLRAHAADILPMQMSLALSLSDAVGCADAKRFHVVRPALETLTAAESLSVVPDYHFVEALELIEAVARELSITRPEALVLVHALFLDGMYVGGENGYWRMFGEGLTLSASEVVALVKATMVEHADLFDRLRLGGMWDEPTTRIVTAILKTALSAERL